MKFKYFSLIAIIIILLSACVNDDETLTASEQELFPEKNNSEIDIRLRELFSAYNTIVEYRYIKNYLDKDWYYITPTKEEVVVPMGQFLMDYWVKPLEAGSSTDFVAENFPKKIILIGSPAYKLDGSKVLGQAEGGTLIRYTEVNDFDLLNTNWISMQLHTAFHEYAHIIHQTFKMPTEYNVVTPDNYTKNGWQTVDFNNAIQRGMVSAYGTSSVSEDFAELFSTYIIQTEVYLNFILNDESLETTEPEEMLQRMKRNEGRVFIRQKLSILKKFLLSAGLNIDKVRSETQKKLNEL